MTPDTAELLNKIRREIADLQGHLSNFEEADTKILNAADEDVTHVFVAQLQKQIATLEALVEKYDPEGFTTIVR